MKAIGCDEKILKTVVIEIQKYCIFGLHGGSRLFCEASLSVILEKRIGKNIERAIIVEITDCNGRGNIAWQAARLCDVLKLSLSLIGVEGACDEIYVAVVIEIAKRRVHASFREQHLLCSIREGIVPIISIGMIAVR